MIVDLQQMCQKLRLQLEEIREQQAQMIRQNKQQLKLLEEIEKNTSKRDKDKP